MSLQELKFYKCKLCEVELVAGKYCIGCSKKNKEDKRLISERNALNTKSKSPGYPFIDPSVRPDYEQEFTGTFAGTSNTIPINGASTTGDPFLTTFTSAGNATNIDVGTSATLSSSSAMDLGLGTVAQFRQNPIHRKRQKNRHK